MATTRQQRLMLLAVCCSVVTAPAFGDRIGRQDLGMPSELAGDPCTVADPGDPQQILGPNPTHASCLTALYPPPVPASSTARASMVNPSQPSGEGFLSISMAGTLWLYIVGIGMLVLAAFNSRKRHRHLPTPDFTGGYSRPPEQRQTSNEGSRWHED